MLSPKRVKHRKVQKGKNRGMAFRGGEISFGTYGLQAVESGRLTAQQIEAARVAMTRHVKRAGRIWIRIFPDHPFTKKPAETRQGKGKGSPEGWEAIIKNGRVLYEMEGPDREVAREAMDRAAAKLPIKCRFVVRGEL